MLHDIYPKHFHVEYHDFSPLPGDTVLLFDGEKICFRLTEENAVFPRYGELPDCPGADGRGAVKLRYLFSIDDERYFMPDIHSTVPVSAPAGCDWHGAGSFRAMQPRHLGFAGITAQQLYLWYASRKYCGRCGTETVHAEKERAAVCPSCGLVEYPKLSPVIIAGVTCGEKLLVTRYKDRPSSRYALVAGFCEIGESLEDTVRREVYEETGVRVTRLRYYKSQPWGFSSSLLSGFFCDLDGSPAIRVDESELAEALWLPRGEIPPPADDISLTAEMMEAFRTGKI